jgi:glycosyltransferase involved in cell wall biosynthesis
MPSSGPVGKICFIAGTLGRGGAERQLIYMLRALKDRGVESRILCLTRGEPLEKEIRDLGIDVTSVGASSSRCIRLVRIIRELRRNRPDIVQSAHFYTNLYAGVAGRVLSIPSIGAIRCDLSSELVDNGIAGWAQLHLPEFQIANSVAAQVRAKANGIRAHFVANAVDTTSFFSAEEPNGHEPLRLLFAGRLAHQKRPDRFLRTVATLARHLPRGSLKAILVGDGPLKAEVLRLAATHKLDRDQFELIGEMGDMRALYRSTHVLLLTSDWEGTPNVLLEAMACEVPVVATRVGGVSSIVAEDRGFVVDVDDEIGLAACVLRLFKDPGLRKTLGARGREYVTRFHSLESLQRNLMGIYEKALAG